MISSHHDILICDDHPICQMGLEISLKSILTNPFQLRKVTSGQALMEEIKQKRPDLIFLDLGLPDTSGLNLIRHLKEVSPQIKIIVVTSCEDITTLQNTIQSKVDALLAKTHSIELLKEAVENLNSENANSPFLDPAIGRLMANEEINQLTPREWEVLELISQGKTNRDIADAIGCSLETVKTHRANLGRKVFARNRAELTAWFLQRKSKSNASFSAND